MSQWHVISYDSGADSVYADYFVVMAHVDHSLWVVNRRSTGRYHVVDGAAYPVGSEPDVIAETFDTEEEAKNVAMVVARMTNVMY